MAHILDSDLNIFERLIHGIFTIPRYAVWKMQTNILRLIISRQSNEWNWKISLLKVVHIKKKKKYSLPNQERVQDLLFGCHLSVISKSDS